MTPKATELNSNILIKDIERLANKFTISQNGCWEWIAYIDNNGYGRISINSKSRLAHRVMYMITNKKLNKSLEIDHLCKNRKCINPKHLEEVEAIENTKRGDAWLYNINKTHCRKGHQYDKDNTYIYSDGRRACRKCDRLRPSRYKKKGV